MICFENQWKEENPSNNLYLLENHSHFFKREVFLFFLIVVILVYSDSR